MKTYIAYVRVSTQRQSDQGTSLTEQRCAIERYADARNLSISAWHEEIETAAKTGRPVFRRMVQELKQGHSDGLVLHKIDRGARNLRDWADLGELIDQGIDVRFAHEDLDLGSRGGRLAADIQAVVASDYVRNLRQEIRKGIEGRLRQGLYPLPAPFGYQDRGAGVSKVPDPVEAPLAVYSFERFAAGDITQRALLEELYLRGMPRAFGAARLSNMLRQPFYAGTITVRGIEYPGIHQPLIERALFDQVQQILARRVPGRRRITHAFRYRRRLHCSCGRTLSGERHKGHVYYRCPRCPGVSAREERFDARVQDNFELSDRRITIDPEPRYELVSYGQFELCTVSEIRSNSAS